ncbi:ArgE/DapE family deacylase [Chloroflexia bacterium SDU3-3]|nr:ArgE/DapE family deacylase [Chloroflexia bacterium SDU3-3]
MNQIERRVVDAIDTEAMLRFLGELVGIRSLDGHESEAQRFMARSMRSFGMAVDEWEIDLAALRQHPAFCWEVERAEGLGVVGWLGEDRGGRSLILNGHVDVVPAGDEANWGHAPWRATLDNGQVYGRGALDMKGGLACALFAAKAIRDAGVSLRGRLLVQSVIGEEDGGCGTLASILRGHTADGAIIPEPTELAIAPAQAGALNFRLIVPGLSAHGCVREEGVSAIEKFIPLHRALLELEAERNARERSPLFARYRLPYPLSIGVLRAGDWPSSVPESLVCEGRYGIAIGEDAASARAEFEAAVARAVAADPWLAQRPPTVEWWGGQFDPAAIPADHPLAQTLAGAYADAAGAAPRFEGMTYGADMRLLMNVGGIPTVMFGPGDVRHAHRPDEHVPLAHLHAAVRTLALAALRFCGYDE